MNIYYGSHMCNVCSAICYLIWLFTLDRPGLNPHLFSICTLLGDPTCQLYATNSQLLQTRFLFQTPNSSIHCLHLDVTNSAHPKLTPDPPAKAALPSAFPSSAFRLLRPKSLESSKFYSFSCFSHPMHGKVNSADSLFKIDPEF